MLGAWVPTHSNPHVGTRLSLKVVPTPPPRGGISGWVGTEITQKPTPPPGGGSGWVGTHTGKKLWVPKAPEEFFLGFQYADAQNVHDLGQNAM